jgi:ATPase family associated with various cellular activities (AAA)
MNTKYMILALGLLAGSIQANPGDKTLTWGATLNDVETIANNIMDKSHQRNKQMIEEIIEEAIKQFHKNPIKNEHTHGINPDEFAEAIAKTLEKTIEGMGTSLDKQDAKIKALGEKAGKSFNTALTGAASQAGNSGRLGVWAFNNILGGMKDELDKPSKRSKSSEILLDENGNPIAGFEATEADDKELNESVTRNIDGIFTKLVGSVYNLKNVSRYAGLAALGTIVIPTASYYAIRALGQKFEEWVLNKKPRLLTDGSKTGRWFRLAGGWRNYKQSELILNPSVRRSLFNIVRETNKTKQCIRDGINMPFSNILVEGPPGNGKTQWAKALAQAANMDFAPTTADKILKAGTEALDELFDFANRSKNGVVIFVDEADALFVDRQQLDADSTLYITLCHLLAITGSGSKKFMLVAATNHSHILDEAMGRRFQHIVHMPNPDLVSRHKILAMYRDTLLLDKKNSKAFVTAAQSLVTDSVIAEIVKQTEGMSGANLEDMIRGMYKKGLCNDDHIITSSDVHEATTEAIDKYNKVQAAKKKGEEHFARLAGRRSAQPTITGEAARAA